METEEVPQIKFIISSLASVWWKSQELSRTLTQAT